jgi:hypothetical protein
MDWALVNAIASKVLPLMVVILGLLFSWEVISWVGWLIKRIRGR